MMKKEISIIEEAKEVSIMEKLKTERHAKSDLMQTDTSYETHLGLIITKKIIKHNTLLWVKCFKNEYTIYNNTKRNNGWYLREVSI
jgi:hypothetical protein